MKTTIDLPDAMYRQVKARSALEGRPVRQVVSHLLSGWLAGDTAAGPGTERSAGARDDERAPSWFGSLREYASNAGGRFDMASVRRSIEHGRRREEAAR